MKNVFKKIAVFMMAIIMGTGVLAGCKPDDDDGDTPKGDTYTYSTFMESSPIVWNPHAHETSADSAIYGYIIDGFYDMQIKRDSNLDPVLDADGNVVTEYVNHMARSKPINVTQDLPAATKEKFGITEESKRRAFKLELNNNAKWENGDPIVAADYLESLELLLAPTMFNYRTTTYISGVAAIAGARDYLYAGGPIYVPSVVYEGETPVHSADEPNYFTMSKPVELFWGYTYSFKDLVDSYGFGPTFIKDGVNLYEKYLAKENKYGFIEMEEGDADNLLWMINAFGAIQKWPPITMESGDWKEATFHWDGESYSELKTSADLGLIVDSTNNAITIIYAAEMSEADLMIYLTSTWLVHAETYKAEITPKSDGLNGTNYCTPNGTTMSYGPYKLTSFQKDKEFILTKNENWYGYTDGQHEGQWQATAINVQIISDHNTAMLKFLNGELDGVDLRQADMLTYGNSSRIIHSSSMYSQRLYLISDLAALTKIENAAGSTSQNLAYLANKDFRKALSLSVNRSEFVNYTGGNVPGYALLNDVYLHDYDNSKVFRRTEYAKQALVDLYGVSTEGKTLDEAYNSITGYDKDVAKSLFQAAYNAVNPTLAKVKDGEVKINIHCNPDLVSEYLPRFNYIQECINAATAGTPLAGKVKLTVVGTLNRYDVIEKGEVESIYGALNGYTAYPLRMLSSIAGIEKDTKPYAYGFVNTKSVKVDLKPVAATIQKFAGYEEVFEGVDFTASKVEVTKSLSAWVNMFFGTGIFVAPVPVADGLSDSAAAAAAAANQAEWADLNAFFTAFVEVAILEEYQEITLSYDYSASLLSYKVNTFLDFEDIKMGYGGMQYYTFNYTDAEWATVRTTLDYTV